MNDLSLDYSATAFRSVAATNDSNLSASSFSRFTDRITSFKVERELSTPARKSEK